jgi:uncharacterized protein (DUF433 family)
MSSPLFMQTAGAAFIADLTEHRMNRVVDEQLMPDVLFDRTGNVRTFTRLCAAFAKFYFDERNGLVARARREVIQELTWRVVRLPEKNDVLDLMTVPDSFVWPVTRRAVVVDVAPYTVEVIARMREVQRAYSLVTTSLEVMGGAPVFAGTRVSIDIVLGCDDAGVDLARLQDSYRFLTVAHVHAARVYRAMHPRRGRPRRFADSLMSAKPRVTSIVRPAAG